jgi:hypothetical protein
MSKFVVVINVTVEYEEDFEELDRMLQRASCISDYEYMHTFDLVDEGEPLNANEGN